MRRFFNEDGSLAYDEINDDENVMYRFRDRILYSKEELVGYMVEQLDLTENDVLINDRTTGIGQAILQKKGRAKTGIVIHADHFSENSVYDNEILWNNYYEYAFSQTDNIDFYVCATDAQNKLLREQFAKYRGFEPNVVTIPVGSIDALKYPSDKGRKPYSLITASRLANEKHVDWVIEAVTLARQKCKGLSLDIYGKGAEEERLKEKAKKLGAEDYIHLMGQRDMKEVYKDYECYVSGSTSEGFGLSLLEAIGSGLPIIGFNVRYGNQTFIDDGRNGYLISYERGSDSKRCIKKMAEAIVKMFEEESPEDFHKHSYETASKYLTKEVEGKWQRLITDLVSSC